MKDQPLMAHAALHDYPIYIGTDLWQSDSVATYLANQRVVVVTQASIIDLHPTAFTQWFVTCAHYDVIHLPVGEQHKTLHTWQTLLDQLQTLQCERNTLLVVVGGGMVGDIAGFAAACYQRGMPYVQIPTTLIAQVDSAIGGKTGVNHQRIKNGVGAIYPPRAVFADIHWLSTLPEREFRAGLAEVVKYALIADANFFDWLTQHAARIIAREKAVLHHLVHTCAAMKVAIVNQDEHEQHGLRSLLNLGHTFGHAFESYYHGQGILHGEAVAIGIKLAVLLSCEIGWLSDTEANNIFHLLHQLVPVDAWATEPVQPQLLLTLMHKDKKVQQQHLYFVLLKSIGHAVLTPDVTTNQVEKVIAKAQRFVYI